VTLPLAATVRLGRLEYDRHVVRVDVTLATLPGIDRADVTLPATVRFEAEPGDTAELDLDGGDGAARVLTGTVAAVDHTAGLAPQGTIRVRLVDAGANLAARRPSTTFRAMTTTEVIERLARPEATDLRHDGGAPYPVYVVDQRRTAAEHVAELAGLGGAIASVAPDGRVTVTARPTGPPTVALRYGRDLTSYRVDQPRPAPATPIAVGHGGGTEGLVPTTDPLTGGAADPSGTTHWLPHARLRSPDAVASATTELQAAAAARTRRLTAEGWLLAHLRPGQLVAVQDLPDGLPDGPWLLRRVHHRLDVSGGRTVLRAEVGGAGAAGLLGLARGLAGALL
jgi:prophage tail gpP-like protein